MALNTRGRRRRRLEKAIERADWRVTWAAGAEYLAQMQGDRAGLRSASNAKQRALHTIELLEARMNRGKGAG